MVITQTVRKVSVATQKSPLVAIVRLLVRGQMGQLLLPEEQVLPVSARPSRGRGLGNRRQVLHEWGPLAGHQWGFLHGHVHKAGNSLVVTIPREEVERLGLREGDIVALHLNRVRVEVELPDDTLSHARQSLQDHAEAYRILANR